MTAMTKERYAELSEIAATISEHIPNANRVATGLYEAVMEIGRLRGVLRDIALDTSSSVPLGANEADHYRGQMRRAITLAAQALVDANPNP